MVNKPLDPVATRLASAGEENADSVVQWIEGQQRRGVMHRRATLCMAGGFAVVTVAATVGSLISLFFAHEMQALFRDDFPSGVGAPSSVMAMPVTLAVVTALLIIGGSFAWASGRVPGLRGVRSAIDWTAAGDAIARLLSIGCTYPEAFKMAAQVTRSGRNRGWLLNAADRTERGESGPQGSLSSAGDAGMLELLVDAGEGEPAEQWRIASDHFCGVARRRLALLLGAVPILATVIAGILVWVAISATLGWMWLAVTELTGGFR
jgi:hypothetical protein